MKIIITIKNNCELKKTDHKRWEKNIKKAEQKLSRDNFVKTHVKFFGKSKIDLSVNEPNDETLEIITHNIDAAKKMFMYYKSFDCIHTSVRFESEIIKEDEKN